MRRYRRLLYISYKDHATNVKVRRKIQAASDDVDKLMTLVKKRKLRWFVHVSMSSGLAKTILQGTLKDKRRGIQKRRWGDNLTETQEPEISSLLLISKCITNVSKLYIGNKEAVISL